MKIFCYGDSNMYGYDPSVFGGGKYDRVWTDIIAEKGHDVDVDAMPGRQTPFRRRPLDIMREQIKEHYDLLIVMLGSNDLDATHSIDTVSMRMETMIKAIIGWNVTDRILMVAPPINKCTAEIEKLSYEMNEALADLAEDLEVDFADAGKWEFELACDNDHLSEKDQETFAEELLKFITVA